jgi:hypothetical protein
MPGFTRRRFCAGAGTALALGAACDPGSVRPPGRTLESFQAALGSAFTVGDDAHQVRLARIRVHQPPIRRPVPRGQSFTLEFEAPQPMALAAGTHPAHHAVLGAFSIFLVPGASSPTGLPTFAATYCRL